VAVSETWAIVTVAAIGAVASVAAGAIGYQSGSNAVDKDYVEMATTILSKKESSPELRRWSVAVLGKLSPVPFGEKLETQLSQGGLGPTPTIYARIEIPHQILERCPDVMKGAKAYTEPLLLKAAKEYEICRAKHDVLNDWVAQMNALYDKVNRGESLAPVTATK